MPCKTEAGFINENLKGKRQKDEKQLTELAAANLRCCNNIPYICGKHLLVCG